MWPFWRNAFEPWSGLRRNLFKRPPSFPRILPLLHLHHLPTLPSPARLGSSQAGYFLDPIEDGSQLTALPLLFWPFCLVCPEAPHCVKKCGELEGGLFPEARQVPPSGVAFGRMRGPLPVATCRDNRNDSPLGLSSRLRRAWETVRKWLRQSCGVTFLSRVEINLLA
jgi:DNA-binding transcriptional LysR family regulator